MSNSVKAAATISPGLTIAMAVAAGVAVANIYYNQPMLGIMEHDLGNVHITGMIPTVTQLGYATGLFFLAPLGDLMDRRRLIITKFILLALTLVFMALAPTAPLAIIAALGVGICATVVQQVVPFAAALAPPAERGKTMGMVMAGMLCGILLSRTLAGFVATQWGWRQMFWLGVPLAIAMSGMMALLLPRKFPHLTISYRSALGSMVGLWKQERKLRFATLIQATLFASFSAFWTVLALHLQEPRFHLGADAAGLFGIVGTVGVIAAPIAGRIADRRGPALVIAASAILVLISWVIFGLWNSVPGLIAGVIALDFAVQSALVSNQHIVFALQPEARSRLNTIFVTGMFLGGSCGSAIAILLWNAGAWSAVCGFGIVLSAITFALVRFAKLSQSDS